MDSLDDPVHWTRLDEAGILAAIDEERELFVAVEDFAVAVNIARRNDRRVHGVEPVLADEGVSHYPSLAIETFAGDETSWSTAATLVATWPRDPNLVVSASFETAADVRARS